MSSDEAQLVFVFFSCEADAEELGMPEQPLYAFERAIPVSMTDTLARRLEAALRAHLSGPRPKEADRGYFTVSAGALADDLANVSISGDTATVDFASTIERHLGNIGTSTASTVFLLEIRAVVFQFPAVRSLVLRVDGDCERFWNLLEATCRTNSPIERG